MEAVGALELGDGVRAAVGPDGREAVDADLVDWELENGALVAVLGGAQRDGDAAAVGVEPGHAESHARDRRVFNTVCAAVL
jgi:hypothetical protein